MRFIKLLALFVFVAGAIYYLYDGNISSNNSIHEASEQRNIFRNPKEQAFNQQNNDTFAGDLYDWAGEDVSALKDTYGDPARKDESMYGHTWWIYNDMEEAYMQFGIKDDIIQTIYVTGGNASLEPLSLGKSDDSIQKDAPFKRDISFEKDGYEYTFHLSEEDMQNQPLIKIDDDLFVQLYMDGFDHSLIAARIVTADILLTQMPYELTYQGSLPKKDEWSKEEWEEIQRGMERQIYDITNVIRGEFEKDSLVWDKNLQEVAFSHSKDMENQDYFAHESPDGDGLTERLAASDISYEMAGENIAADYIDGPAVVSGWLNSEEHRDILLQDDFTHLGVGVYRNYFTQNYLK